jgi:molybdate transport system substrate-binding protein
MLTRRAVIAKVVAAMAAVAATWASLPSIAQAQEKPLVFAAASLKNALDSISAAWKAETGKEATISYESSGNLAKQIEGGAPADIFISADQRWMNYLSEKNLTKAGSEVKLLGNGLVLVVPADSTATMTIAANFDLAGLIGDGKLAMGDVKSVPAGAYGKAALEALGVWASVEGKIAQAENVRAALKLVAIGEAAAGIVYTTDAKAEKGVKVIGTFPADSHPPIVYPVAQTAESKAADAGEFLKYLQSAKAKGLFEAQGFNVLAPAPTN